MTKLPKPLNVTSTVVGSPSSLSELAGGRRRGHRENQYSPENGILRIFGNDRGVPVCSVRERGTNTGTLTLFFANRITPD